MFIFLTILILLAAILLVIAVVIQNSKGGGLASGFSTGNQVLGVRKTTDFLEKTTWYLTAVIIVLSITTTAFIPKGNVEADSFHKEVQQSIRVEDKALPNLGREEEKAGEPLPAPAQEEPQQAPDSEKK